MSLTWKIEPGFSMVLLSVGQHLSLWPAIKTLFPDRKKLQSELHQIQWCKSSFFSQSFIWYLTGISKYSDNAMSEFKVNFEWQKKHDL